MHAVGEMQALDAAFERLKDRAWCSNAVWERLRASGNPQKMKARVVNAAVQSNFG